MHRVGILGMGRWGQTWLRVLGGASRTEVVSVAARGRRAEIGSLGARLTIHDDFRELLREDDLDVVIVALPPEDHLEAVEIAIERNMAVLCEKPAVATRASLPVILELCHRSHAPVRVNQNYRLRPWAHAVRLHLPSIGPLRRVSIDFAQPEFSDSRRARLSHPLLADMAIHHLDLLRFLTGQEAEVRDAQASRVRDARLPGMTDVEASLVLGDGASATYRGTWAARSRSTPWDADWTFEGDRGTISVRDLAVHVACLGRPPQHTPFASPVEDEDLLIVWEEFLRVLAGHDRREPATVEDHARSLQLVFDIAEAAGVPDPSAPVEAAPATNGDGSP